MDNKEKKVAAFTWTSRKRKRVLLYNEGATYIYSIHNSLLLETCFTPQKESHIKEATGTNSLVCGIYRHQHWYTRNTEQNLYNFQMYKELNVVYSSLKVK